MPAAPFSALTESYAEQITPILSLAQKAYGSRDRVSPQHDASREYTRLLVEFVDEGGSLLELSKKLEVEYSALRRRWRDATLPAMQSPAYKPRSQRTEEYLSMCDEHIASITFLRENEAQPEEYHQALLEAYDAGVSMSLIASAIGLSSTGALYYGVNAARARNAEAA